MLDGKRILIVEDEALLALDLSQGLQDCGAQIVGPCYQLATALEMAGSQSVDAAILDVDLNGETVFALADRLRQASVPFIFNTGRSDIEELTRRYRDTCVCLKPSSADSLAQAVSHLLDD